MKQLIIGLSKILSLSILVLLNLTSFSKTENNVVNKQEIFAPDTIFSEIENKLNSLKGVELKKTKGHPFFNDAYELLITQPFDHKNPDGEKFIQRVFLSHLDFDKPVLFVTEGYGAYYAQNPNYINELSPILNSNQIIVEHRYFGKSLPDSIDWQYLTIEQSANDHHRIIEILKQIYPEKWVSTGISKGGQTSMYHRYFFPDDVDATIPYVGPLNFSIEDTRVYDFFEQVGSEECRDKLYNLQIELLKNKDKLMPYFSEFSDEYGYEYPFSDEAAFEYVVLEYPFAYWQWSSTPDCSMIPESADSAKKIISYLNKMSSFDYFSVSGIKKLQPFFYQALTEIGYYGYDTTYFKGLVTSIPDNTFSFCAPENTKVEYNPKIMKKVNKWIQKKGDNFIFIYGELDPWSATAVDLKGKTNSIKIVKKEGCHRTRINNLPASQRKIIFSTLNEWLGLNIKEKK